MLHTFEGKNQEFVPVEKPAQLLQNEILNTNRDPVHNANAEIASQTCASADPTGGAGGPTEVQTVHCRFREEKNFQRKVRVFVFSSKTACGGLWFESRVMEQSIPMASVQVSYSKTFGRQGAAKDNFQLADLRVFSIKINISNFV